MKIETGDQFKFTSSSIKVPTTAGTMFVAIMEDPAGDPIGIQLNIGKAGGELSALAHGLARVCTLSLDKGAALTDLIQELSNHTTDKSVMSSNGTPVRSVVDGLVWALIEYNRGRYAERIARVGGAYPRLGG